MVETELDVSYPAAMMTNNNNNNNNGLPTSIPEYFVGQEILLTGGTGLMGKILVEKILRCCPDVGKIYILMRPKRHGTIEERWQEIIKLPLFDLLRSTNPHAFKKVCLINGDISLENLGLAEDNIKMLIENVTIVYHAAAMIQFTDNLHELLVRNTKATYILLSIAKSFKKLQIFTYVSTAFSNMNIPCDQVEERVLPACQDWRVILKLLETDSLVLVALKEKLMCGHPNPYTWSKSLSEQIVDEHKVYFPTIIIRPAIVCSTFKEPFEGWADILCGLSAISVPIALGLMRTTYTRSECYQDYIPADTAINAILSATWKKFKEPEREVTSVYNCGVVKDVPITTHELISNGKQIVEELPSKFIVWAFHPVCTTNDYLFYILFVFLQVIPGAAFDLALLLMGKKPMLLNLTKKAANVFRLFKDFSSRQLAFPSDKFKELDRYLNKEDKRMFSVSVEGLTPIGLMRLGFGAAIRYYLKEDLSEENLRKNERRYFWINVADKCFIYASYTLAAWLMYRFLTSYAAIRDIGYITYKSLWE